MIVRQSKYFLLNNHLAALSLSNVLTVAQRVDILNFQDLFFKAVFGDIDHSLPYLRETGNGIWEKAAEQWKQPAEVFIKG